MSSVWLIVNVASMIVLLVAIVLASLSPRDRGFIPGLLLIGAGVVGFTLQNLHIIPREWSFTARTLSLGIAILGLVLMERVWKAMRSSGGRPS